VEATVETCGSTPLGVTASRPTPLGATASRPASLASVTALEVNSIFTVGAPLDSIEAMLEATVGVA